MLTLNWVKCSDNQWCRLLNVNLEHSYFYGLEGVYIIWHGQPDPAVVYVGQGNIKDRLLKHRQEAAILAYKDRGLYVTWAKVESQYRDGIERFLAERWKPKVGKTYPDVTSMPVNSPW